MSRDLFETDSQHKVQLVKELIEIAKELGWSISLPLDHDGEEVPGMIVGTTLYVAKTTNILAKGKFPHE